MADTARASPATVRLATAADSEALGRTLARAFLDDPLTVHFFPDAARRSQKLSPMFRLLFKLGLPHGACYVTGNYESVALWRPPGHWHLHVWDYVVNAPAMLSIFGGNALNIVSTMDRIEKQHPKANHWYLQTVGTDPDKQGKGFGGAIIRHQLALADAAGVPCYLESSKELPGEIWLDTLKKLPPITVSMSQTTDKGPITAVFKGALLWTVIDNAGWVNGPEKNAYLRHTILVTGKDGYAAALSEGELDPKLEGKQVILAYEKDGVPLDTPHLVVPGDAHASRGVHDVVAIDVR